MLKDQIIDIADIYIPAKRRNNLNQETVDALAESILEEGMKVPIQVRKGDGRYVLLTGLHRLAGETSSWSDEEKVPFASLLLDHGAGLEVRDDELRSTPLGHACRYGLVHLSEVLLERGASVEPAKGADWTAPLVWARQHGHQNVVQLLEIQPRHPHRPEEKGIG